MISDKDHKAINTIMGNFDFEKVCRVMLMLNWQWVTVGSVPSIIELRNEARRLLEDSCHKNLSFISCGGFYVFREGDGLLHLQFSISAWDTYD